MPAKRRQIIFEHSFERDLAALIPSARRAAEFVEGAVEILSRRPDKGWRIRNTNVYHLSTTDTPHVTPLVIYYTFDDERVYLIKITIPPGADIWSLDE